MQFFILVLFVPSGILAIKCYTGLVTGNTKPTETSDCISDRCLKVTGRVSETKGAIYDCGAECLNLEGCVKTNSDSEVCCCSKNLCNSSTTLSITVLVVSAALGSIFVL
ncbi:hypothetical protein RB195_003059 [Necator americanus]|uniref:Uncharacterized protein n=2 Tax=Necator americanus TaxID=51031 RepID=A0ABR1DLY1_NECAM|nr:hypothetical protein NECAME_17908 [Necator americanus]ETN81355.1 hypothetical protein NECAME_17908 [Necator americanus]